MKNLKKFNENWIDDETEDTNRRISELDNKEGIDNNEEEDNVSSFESDIITTLNDADDVLSAEEFAQLAESIINYIDEISKSKQ